MSDKLRDQLKASIKKLEEERLEVLKEDEKIFGNSTSSTEETNDSPSQENQNIPEHEESPEVVENDYAEEEKAEEDTSEQEISPLAHWPEEKKKTFQNLNAEAKKFILDRERDFNSDYTKKTQKLAEERKKAEKYDKAISPHAEYLKSIGLDPYEASASLIAFERQLRTATPTEKAKLLKNLAEMYQVNFTNDEDEPTEEVSPVISRLEKELQEQRAALARLENDRKNTKDAELSRIVNDFKNTKDSAGKLKYPHFDKVMRKMGDLITISEEEGEPITMEQAYEDACLLNKELRSDILKKYTESKYREEDNKKRLSASKNASFMVKSGGTVSKETPKQLSIREALKRAMNEANAYS